MRRVLVSLHDVHAGNSALAERYLRTLEEWGAARVALLVVPRYHGRDLLAQSPDFQAFLRREIETGREVFLHGLRHAAGPAEAFRSVWGRFVNRRLTRGEAEFCGLPAAAQEARLEEALRDFRACGLPVQGFVAPTWFGTPAPALLRKKGFPLAETRWRVLDLEKGRSFLFPPFSFYQVPTEARWLLPQGPLASGLRALPRLRLALHPGDLELPYAPAFLRSLLHGAACIGYREFLRRP